MDSTRLYIGLACIAALVIVLGRDPRVARWKLHLVAGLILVTVITDSCTERYAIRFLDYAVETVWPVNF
jgi:hypothetical protein